MKKLTKAQKAEKQTKAIGYLKEYLADSCTVYCFAVSTSASGMSHAIACFIPYFDKSENIVKFLNVSFNVSLAVGYRYSDQKRAVIVQGAGMDMGFHLVESLGQALGLKLRNQWL